MNKNLTKLEQETIELIKSDMEWNSDTWFHYWLVENYSNIDGSQLRGVFSSLVQKGILEKDEYKDEHGLVTVFRFIK